MDPKIISLTLKPTIDNKIIFSVPTSKSISNRLLIIHFLAKSNLPIPNLSQSEDTQMLKQYLHEVKFKLNNVFDCKNSGTVVRFLISVLAITPGQWIITGSERLAQRPIIPLIDILNDMGAKIDYNSTDIFPIQIIGSKLISQAPVVARNSLTSQIISSLLLISPYIDNGLSIYYPKSQTSISYINMTIEMMNYFGVQIINTLSDDKVEVYSSKSESITCVNCNYKYQMGTYEWMPFDMEMDYSAACVAYCFACVARLRRVFIPGLQPSTLQGDSQAEKIFATLGVKTTFKPEGAMLSYYSNLVDRAKTHTFVVRSIPDMFLPLVVACYFVNIEAYIKGVQSLNVKESDRLTNIINDLNRFDEKIVRLNPSTLYIGCSNKNIAAILKKNENIQLDTYNDHRMAMSLASLCFKSKKLRLTNPMCVNKSFPDFWQVVSQFFDIEYL